MNYLKVFLLSVTLTFSASSVVGQGTVVFANNVSFPTQADRLVRDVDGATLVGTNYFAQLYYGASGASEMDLISVSDLPARFRSSTTTQPGTWNEGATSFRTLNGFVAGDAVSLQVCVWNSVAGSSWEAAQMAGFGETQYGASAVFPYRVPPAGSGAYYAYYMDNFRGFMLVPEPSVIALAVLGVGGFLLLRRRK